MTTREPDPAIVEAWLSFGPLRPYTAAALMLLGHHIEPSMCMGGKLPRLRLLRPETEN